LRFPPFLSRYQPDDVLLVKLVPGAKKAFTRLAVNGGQRFVSQIMVLRYAHLSPANAAGAARGR
jgi:hypothetical protein